MKVLQISAMCGVGSVGRIATDLYKLLEQQNYECLIAYGRGASPKGINSYKIGNDVDVNLHGIFSRIMDRHGFFSKNATKQLIEKIIQYNPDVIHLHCIHGYYINIEVLFEYLSLCGKPIVWTMHDCWAITGHCAYFTMANCEKWKKECFSCPQKTKYPASYLLDNSKYNYNKKRKIFNSVNNMTIVTPSQWLANIMNGSYLSRYPVQVINNGIDLEVFKPIESKFRKNYGLENKIIVLGVANVWEERKGLQYMLELAEQLDDNYKIVLVGINAKQKKKISEKIIVIGRTNNIKELAEIYSAADVFVNPTLEDNFPTTNLEALACGTPVITFETGGSSESIDTDTGMVVVNKTTGDLIKAIYSLQKSNLTDNCVKKAWTNYEKDDCYQKYIDLYRHMGG